LINEKIEKSESESEDDDDEDKDEDTPTIKSPKLKVSGLAGVLCTFIPKI
jgi:hypothetical protein